MKNTHPKQIVTILSLIYLFILASCANIPLKTIPPPLPTTKLRVYVQPITGPFPYSTGTWGMSHKEYVEKNMRGVESFLKKIGIYEVVPGNEVEEVLGGQELKYWEMERNGWRLARDIGKALYAEYAFIVERSLDSNKISGTNLYITIIMINIDTGKRFEARAIMWPSDAENSERRTAIITELYRNVFSSIKQDMLETAVRKSERVKMTPSEPKMITAAPDPKALTQAPTPEIKSKMPEILKPVGQAPLISSGKNVAGMERLVIYDLEAPENYKTVALILTEVLREEIFRLNRFTLVTRETLKQILNEMTLQQTGLIDEKQAVKAGKGLAANQIITGKLGMLGKTYILQAKRIDVETFATLGFASTKFVQGQEEDVLSRLPDLAKSLAGLQQ